MPTFAAAQNGRGEPEASSSGGGVHELYNGSVNRRCCFSENTLSTGSSSSVTSAFTAAVRSGSVSVGVCAIPGVLVSNVELARQCAGEKCKGSTPSRASGADIIFLNTHPLYRRLFFTILRRVTLRCH